ncbi:hypothetical protein DYB35_007221 [Aphanomyces astaci]|uniref:Uncharacterized protein n=2 Tax=Aphanomyces astaci TaxID=112090 RepID=A0A3R6XZS6_APHAT|nr:hypothetical protein DYB35_007221 [Aphanomyces astaci]
MERLRLDMYYRYLTPLVAVAHGHIVPPSSHDHPSWNGRLPLNVGLTSLEAHSPKCIRLRLTHLFAVDEHPVWSQPATVSLATLLGPSFESFSTVWEISLTGNRRVLGPFVMADALTIRPMHVRAFEICQSTGYVEEAVSVDGFDVPEF